MQFIIDDEVIKGHDKYLKIMQDILDPSIDVSNNSEFQKAYSGYYFPAQVNKSFKEKFFSYMQQSRYARPSYEEVLNHLYEQSGDVHYSFASKLLHTIDPDLPILDRHVMRLLGFQLMPAKIIKKSDRKYEEKKKGDAQRRINYYCDVFDVVIADYRKYENEHFMKDAITRFDMRFPEYKDISYMKKIDMLIFRLRDERAVSVLDYLYKTC